MSEISREELLAFTEAHAKSSIALEKIGDRLGDIVKNQEAILLKISNGMTRDIVDGVSRNSDAIYKDIISSLGRNELATKGVGDSVTTTLPAALLEKVNNSDIAKDMGFVKTFVSIFGVVALVAFVVLKVFFTPQGITKDEIRQMIQSESFDMSSKSGSR